MDDLRAILDQLDDRELDYVYERSRQKSDAAAYEAANIPKSTFYGWPADRRAQLNEWAQVVKRETTFRALRVIEENAEDAARKIVALLTCESESVALRAAQDILDRALGTPKQSVDMTSGGEKLNAAKVVLYMPDNGRDDSDDHDRPAEGATGGVS